MQHDLVIITGSSKGLGLALAQALCQPQTQLLCISRTYNTTLDPLARQHGATIEQWQLDLTHSIEAATQLKSWFTGLNPTLYRSATLINNACMIPAVTPLHAAQAPDIADALRLGLETPMLLSAAFLYATRDWTVTKKILNISSGLGRRAMASQAPYCAAKAGLDHFTRCMALDEALQPHGAQVCSLAPGVIDTDMQVHLRQAAEADFPDRNNFVALKHSGQLTSPHEAAERVLRFLQRPDFGSQPVADVRN
jgi:NAD(P)-dependent dehydrogenase (short-subunit alcohol dehydrogenase family)